MYICINMDAALGYLMDMPKAVYYICVYIYVCTMCVCVCVSVCV